jgi:hypothetical protein
MITDTTANEKWLLDKWGCFSASEMHKLLSKGVGEMFGKGAKTYIEEVAIEAYTMFNMDENVETYAMKMGKIREAESFYYYIKLLGIQFMEYYGGDNPVFKKYCEDSGCSPDSLAKKADGTASFGAEFKNNQRKQHFTDLRTINEADDLKKEHIDDYTQCQFSMMCYKTDLWHWCSYNEYFPEKDKMLIIEVKEDKSFQDNLIVRLAMAKKIKYRIIEQRNNNYKGEIDFK